MRPGCPKRPFFHTETIDGRGCAVPPSGQCDVGFAELVAFSPGCCTATSTRLSVTTGPHVSAPTGTERNCLTWPRSGPVTGTENRPSFAPSVLPSVATHRLPCRSKATLSGQEIGLTWLLSKPPKEVSAAAGAPQTSSSRQENRVEAASPPFSSHSRTWPFLLPTRGFT